MQDLFGAAAQRFLFARWHHLLLKEPFLSWCNIRTYLIGNHAHLMYYIYKYSRSCTNIKLKFNICRLKRQNELLIKKWTDAVMYSGWISRRIFISRLEKQQFHNVIDKKNVVHILLLQFMYLRINFLQFGITFVRRFVNL